MDWQPVVKTVEPFIVKIETQDGHGAGFICFRNDWAYGIATAAHVVDTAEQWHQPVRVRHYVSNKTGFFADTERVIFVDKSQDSAMLLVPHADLVVPHEFPKLLPTDSPIAIGNEVGWLGFPGIAADTLCFFNIHGHLSCPVRFVVGMLHTEHRPVALRVAAIRTNQLHDPVIVQRKKIPVIAVVAARQRMNRTFRHWPHPIALVTRHTIHGIYHREQPIQLRDRVTSITRPLPVFWFSQQTLKTVWANQKVIVLAAVCCLRFFGRCNSVFHDRRLKIR